MEWHHTAERRSACNPIDDSSKTRIYAKHTCMSPRRKVAVYYVPKARLAYFCQPPREKLTWTALT